MALIHLDHFSDSVGLNLPLYIALPEPGKLAETSLESCKVLYLLHGLSDDASAWQRYTRVEYLAREMNLVVVMPSAGRSLYTDQANGQAYFTYITRELPQYLSEVFKFNLARENTAIAGNSMGGFGAFKAGFIHPELYGTVAAFSGLLSLNVFLMPIEKLHDPELMREMEMVFGSYDQIPGSDNDVAVWLRKAAANPSVYPALYAWCGNEDDLLPINRAVVEAATQAGIRITYTEAEGRHDWYFWDTYLERFLRIWTGATHD